MNHGLLSSLESKVTFGVLNSKICIVKSNKNRFKGLDLVDRMPEELWREVHDIVQEAVINTIPEKKRCEKAKWLSEEALQISEKIRDTKGKGEKERYTHLNAEF